MSRVLAEMQKKERDAAKLKQEVDSLAREIRQAKGRVEVRCVNAVLLLWRAVGAGD